jgi:hypothetical protein
MTTTMRISLFLIVALLVGVRLPAGDVPAHRANTVLEEFVHKKANFPQCHTSPSIKLADSTLICAFFGCTQEGGAPTIRRMRVLSDPRRPQVSRIHPTRAFAIEPDCNGG